MGKVKVSNITESNNLIYANAALLTLLIGIKKTSGKQKDPWWKRRLSGHVKQLTQDTGCIRKRKLLRKSKVVYEKDETNSKERDYLLRGKKYVMRPHFSPPL